MGMKPMRDKQYKRVTQRKLNRIAKAGTIKMN